jgi:hypothetical protein
VDSPTRPSHNRYKTRFLAAEAWQKSQYGLIDMFKRDGKWNELHGIVPEWHTLYVDRSYAEIRGWK